ncbi:hypothetical protein DFP73DRAFT_591946 [Morchella snyderi]|nr:hypothetical protein DFP73DRAFT_591946 [Morchella snyderi]
MSCSPVAYLPSSPPYWIGTPSRITSDIRVEIYARLVEIKMLFHQMDSPGFPRDSSHEHCKISLVEQAKVGMALVTILENLPLVMEDSRGRAKFISEVGIQMTGDDVDQLSPAVIEKMSVAIDAIFTDVTIWDAKQMVAIMSGGSKFYKGRALVIADNVRIIQEQIKQAGFVLEGVRITGNEFSINLLTKSMLITQEATDAKVPPSECQGEGVSHGLPYARRKRRRSRSASGIQQQVADYEAVKAQKSVEELLSSERTTEDDWEENDRCMRSLKANSTVDNEDKEVDGDSPLNAQGTNTYSGSIAGALSPHVAQNNEHLDDQQTEHAVSEEYRSIEWPSSPPSIIFTPIDNPQRTGSSKENTPVGSKSSRLESSPPIITVTTHDEGKAVNRGSPSEFTSGLLANQHPSGPSPSPDPQKTARPDTENAGFEDNNLNACIMKGTGGSDSGFFAVADGPKEWPLVSVTKPLICAESQVEDSHALSDVITHSEGMRNNLSLSAAANRNAPKVGKSVSTNKTGRRLFGKKDMNRERKGVRRVESFSPGAVASTMINEGPQFNARLLSSPKIVNASKPTTLEPLGQISGEEERITSATHVQNKNKHAILSNITKDFLNQTTAPVTKMAPANTFATLGKKHLFGPKRSSMERNAAANYHILKYNGGQSESPSGARASSGVPGRGSRKRTRTMSEEDDPTQHLPRDPAATPHLSTGKCLVANNGSPVVGERCFKKARYNACSQKMRVDTIDYYTLRRPFKPSRFGRRGTRARPSCCDGKENPFLTTGTPDIVERRRLFFSKRAADVDGYDSDTREMAERFPAQYAQPGRIYDSSPETTRTRLLRYVSPTLVADNAVSFVSEEAKDRAITSWAISDEDESPQRSGFPSAPRKAVLPRIPLKRKSRN